MNEREETKAWLEEQCKRLSTELAQRMFNQEPYLNAIKFKLDVHALKSGPIEMTISVGGDKPPRRNDCDDVKKECSHDTPKPKEEAPAPKAKVDPKSAIPLSKALSDALNQLAEDVIARKKKE